MNHQLIEKYLVNPGEMSVISSSKKFVEILRAVHETWSNQEPDFDQDLTGYDFYAKDLFMNDYFIYFSAVQGNVRNRNSPLLDSGFRGSFNTSAKRLFEDFRSILTSSEITSPEVERMLIVKNKFSEVILNMNFPESTREDFQGLRPEVAQLDSWVSEIISEVVTSSYFGFGAPNDPEDAVFYMYVKDKEELVAASLLIGASFIDEWLRVSPVRGIIGRNELDDDEALDRLS